MTVLFDNWQHYRRQTGMRASLLTVLFVLLLAMFFGGISSGAVNVSLPRATDILMDSIADGLGINYNSGLDYQERDIAQQALVVRNIRLPRVILGGLVGAGLALAGASLQGVFRNPLVDPGLVGISSGAAVGAVTAILIGVDVGAMPGYPDGERLAQSIFAFFGALLTTLLVYRLAYRQQRTDSTTLLLVGLAINAIAASYVGMVTYIAGPDQIGDISFWTLGSAAEAFWRDVHLMLPIVVVGGLVTWALAAQLNLMALGEAEARHLGVRVERLRIIIMSLAALMTGIGVALVGIVGFVGLVVPHLIRLLFGPDHRLLLPASALGGAILVIAADWFARTVALPTEVPLGVVTTLVGGPFLLTLILIYRRSIDT